MRKAIATALIIMIFSPAIADSQTRRRTAPRRGARPSNAAAEAAAELQAGRNRVAAQIKTLTQFLYLLGGVTRGIESADQAARGGLSSSAAIEQNELNKTKVRESVRNVREGLEKLEADFRLNPALRNHYAHLSGVAGIGAAAESQAAANRFDEAGRSLLKAVNQLADALAAMR